MAAEIEVAQCNAMQCNAFTLKNCQVLTGRGTLPEQYTQRQKKCLGELANNLHMLQASQYRSFSAQCLGCMD